MNKRIPAEKLEALLQKSTHYTETSTIEGYKHAVLADDLRALIDAEPESVEPVAVIALKNAELNNRVCVLEDLLSSAYAIANRNGSDTHWPRFASQLHINGISPITAKTFKVLPSDIDYSAAPQDNLIADKQAEIERMIEQRDRLLQALGQTAKAVIGYSDYWYDKGDMDKANKYNEMLGRHQKLIAEIEANK